LTNSNGTIPNSVTNIGSYAFSGTHLTSFDFPTNIGENIGDGAFSDTLLTNLIIPPSITSIGNGWFGGCAYLTNVTFPDTLTYIGPNAFGGCSSLLSTTIPASVTNVGSFAFYDTVFLNGIYFAGNAPVLGMNAFGGENDGLLYSATLYYLPGTTDWTPTYGGYTDILWNPQAQTGDGFFGVRTNRFGFNITGTSNVMFVVEACTNLAHPVWQPLGTYTLTGSPVYFSDAQWMNWPGRYYRFRSP